MIIEITKDNISILDDSNISPDYVLSLFDSNPFAKFLVCVVDGTVVGYLYYRDIYVRIEINQITVFDYYKRRGYGSMLMEKVLSFGKNVSLEVNVNNISAIDLYKKYGFRIVSVRKGYYDGVDGYLMVIDRKWFCERCLYFRNWN